MTRRVGRLSGVIAVVCVAWPVAARAQTVGADTAIDAQTFWPAAGPTEHLALRGSTVSPSGAVGFGLIAHFMRQPLVFSPDASPDARAAAVDYAFTTDFLFHVGFLRRFQVGIAVPVVVAQSGEGAVPLNVPGAQRLGDTALRDLRFEVSWAVLQRARTADARGVGLRIDLGGAIPFGDDKGFNSSGTFTFAPMAVLDWRTAAITVTANLGARLRGTSSIANLAVGSVGVAGLGVAVRPTSSRRLGFSADYVSTLPLVSRDGYVTATTQEVFLGVRYATDEARDMEIFVGGAVPLSSEPLVPAWRGIAGIQYAPRGNDADDDGVLDADDQCVHQSEDRDNFSDDDGCPDPDNDADGVLDTSDRCPDEAEDADNHDDADGCPDPDNDGDHVDDADDQCPDVASGEHPDSARAGCPIPDTDHDGVLDPDDRCVDVATGPRPDPSRAGCPLPDRDGDGVVDAQDQCPDAAAGNVPDRFRAGCADVDPDRDGVVGEADRCPDRPETINGVTDNDGCPDNGAEAVTWDPLGTSIQFTRPLVVPVGAQVLTPPLRALVAQAAQRIRARGAEVTRVIIEVMPGLGAPGVADATRRANVVLDAMLAERIPQRMMVARAMARPAAPPRVAGQPVRPPAVILPGTVFLRVETQAAH